MSKKPKREGIAPGLRWRVFARDDFTCVYCGRGPTEAVMHVDHVIAVANGGTNDETNLVTSCSDCNIGKGAKHLTKPATREAGNRMAIAVHAFEELNDVGAAAHQFALRQMSEIEAKGVSEEAAAMAVIYAWLGLSAAVWKRAKLPTKKRQFYLKLAASIFDDVEE